MPNIKPCFGSAASGRKLMPGNRDIQITFEAENYEI